MGDGTVPGLTSPPAALAARLLPDDLDTPAVVVDRSRLARNIATMSARVAARGAALRPHAKTHKSIAIGRLQLDAGAVGLSCATIGEAEVFVRGGCDDVFIAYPVYAGGPVKPRRLRALQERMPKLRVGVDSAAGAQALGTAVRGSPSPLEVLIEIDSGLRRTGVLPDGAVAVAEAAESSGLRVVGVFTHGGHGYAIGRTEQAAADEVDSVVRAAESLERAGFQAAVRSVGSTPTSTRRPPDQHGVTEERPGIYVFGDRQQLALGAAGDDEIALTIAATVVSASVPGQVVLDAGSKVLSSDQRDWLAGFGVLCGWPGATISRLNEHHAIVTFEPGSARPAVGDVVAVVPNHVCSVVNLASELAVVEDGRLIDRWPVDAAGKNR